MTVTSFWFLVLLLLGVIVYYMVPKCAQWVVLLLLSVIFYVNAATPYTIAFLAASSLIAYFATLYISSHQGTASSKAVSRVAIFAVVANILIWFLLKGTGFWRAGFRLANAIDSSIVVPDGFPFVAAMGMGYYTSQIIGYILDVLWGNAKVQKNPLKLFLFVSFFPQLTTGPISQYAALSPELYGKHKFQYSNLCLGSQRILWGFFKKLVISDRVAIIVNAIWANTETYTGLWPWIAVFLYPLEIYTDFSGCMDVVLGAAELFDIHLAENFKNPFFSRTVQEFWQRWHITLGGWAKTYVFYPFMKSRWMVNLGKSCKKKYGKRWGKFIPWTISLAVLWFVMGFWHGSAVHILGVSAWYFCLLFLSELFQPVTRKLTAALEIKTESFGWHFFQCARTYVLYAIGTVFFSGGWLSNSLSHFGILFKSLRKMNPWTLFDGTILQTGVSWGDINLIIIGVLLLVIVAILREKYGYARKWMQEQSFGFRWGAWLTLLVLVMIFGMYGPGYDASTFIYQGF